MMRFKRFLVLLTLNVVAVSVLFEITLRIFPGVIPPTLLYRFSEHLKSEIAPGRYSTKADARLVERSDGGPPFRIRVPFAKAVYSYQDPGSVNEVVMDEMGFCNKPDAYKPENISIITLGDSFTWCTTVNPEQAWPAKLSEISGRKVYNLGNPAIGLYEHIQLLEKFGLQKEPEVVVMNVYEGNDIRDAIRFKEYLEDGDRKDNGEEDLPLLFSLRQRFANTRIGKRSYAVNLAVATLRQLYVTLPVKIKRDQINYQYEVSTNNSDIPYNLQNTDVDEVKIAFDVVSNPDMLRVFDDALGAFMNLSREYNFIPIVVYTPTSYTAQISKAVLKNSEIADSLQEFTDLQRDYFRAQAVTLGFSLIDVTDLFQEKFIQYNEEEKLLYYQTNLHLTKFGHALLAGAIADYLPLMGSSTKGINPAINK